MCLIAALPAESGAGKSYKQEPGLPANAWKKPKIPVKDHHVVRAVGGWLDGCMDREIDRKIDG